MKRRFLALVVALSAACGTEAKEEERTLTVLAASSLTATFTELAEQFEQVHEGVEVKLVFDSSATLAEAVIDGAPGDVLATADEKTARHAQDRGGVAVPEQFATNVLAVAVPQDNPARIDDFADLDHDAVDYVTCVPTAPCGAAAVELLDAAAIAREPVSEEVDVKAVLAKVVAGEADAGLVYRTDVTAAGDAVRGLAIPAAADDPNTYWVAVTENAGNPTLAAAWVEMLTGPTGFDVLADAGFGPPQP